MKKLTPAADEFTVRLVRGFSSTRPSPPSPVELEGARSGFEGARSELEGARSVQQEREGGRERSKLVGTTILVDSLHPDFQAR